MQGPPQPQWQNVQPSNQQMNMNYGIQVGGNQQPPNIPPQQRGPPLQNANQSHVVNYSSPQPMHQGINSQPPIGMVNDQMMINQQPQQGYGVPFGSIPSHNRSQNQMNDPSRQQQLDIHNQLNNQV
jgi:hypothetical protein